MSDISFNAIPPDVRVPLAYIEFDNSNAVSGTPAPRQRVLMFGQSNKGASAAPDVPVRIRSGSQASAAFGQGSMLALMADAFLKANRVAELWCIPQAKNPGNTISKTTVGMITLSGTATENGSLVTYIAGQRLAGSVAAGTKGSKLAGLLTDRINGHPDLPVKAVLLSTTPDDAGATDIVLTAKFTGALSAVDVRWNYYAGETTPYGIITAFKAESRKYINPDISASIAGMGDLQYKYIVMPYTDEPNLNLLRTELQERWGPVSQADGFAVTVLSGTYGDISTFGVRRNDHLISCMGIADAPEPSYLYAATLCAVASQALSIDPARPLQTLTLPGRMPPAVGDRFTWSERNALLFDGISTFNVNDGGEMQIERMITMYRTNKYGDSDPSYLNVNTIATLSYLRYSLRTRITQKFPNHKLASDGTRFATGQAVVTPSVIKTELLALFEEWENAGLVEDFDTFKEELYVARNKDDKDRLDVLCGPNLINQFRIFAAQVQFIL
ncbi:phage tail sheath family protein [Escherichia coli P0299917.10]|uniref:phage tail sheath subtilisin-like domain-containing protein n=1 Tax=Escherichia coli TaxID=562 RepID=UPI0002CC8294|nr:phage tail sheath subtilisin-like domain-containing protein [Escherichia coli]ENC41664.1 phage tail sheath family protein [Escherichia coli P0299917.10]ENC43281.1 phage tail sheath family protein [Escherichia coli P0299917.10]ENC44231.1 phage tail sheath family protein [Escherichia coli P0299917.10]